MDPIDPLIRDLEAATEGSRELDGEIALSLGWVKHHAGWAHWTTPAGLENQHVPFFSDSLDDALSLVPEGTWYWHIRKHKSRGRSHDAIVTLRKPGETADKIQFQVNHKTPALALCIAALKARRGA